MQFLDGSNAMLRCDLSGPADNGSRPATGSPAEGGAAGQARSAGCPAHVLEAIYGKKPANKAEVYDHSLKRCAALAEPQTPSLQPLDGASCADARPPRQLGARTPGRLWALFTAERAFDSG